MATFYVRKTGSNSNSGTSGSPWLTIGFGLGQIAAGDTLIVGDGTYNEGNLQTSGSAGGGYKTVRSENKWGAHVVAPGSQRCFGGSGGQYFVIDGFKLTSPLAHGVELENSHHIKVQNCWALNCANSGISLLYGEWYWIEDNLCEGNAWSSWYSGISIYQARAISGDNTAGSRIFIRRNVCRENFTNTFLLFDGGTSEIFVGDTVTGQTSGASGTVARISLSSGSWGAGTAAGEIGFIDQTVANFSNNENLRVGGVTKALANGTSYGGPFTDGNGIICDDWQNLQNNSTAGNFTGGGIVENNLCYRNGAKGIQIAWSDGVMCRNNTTYQNNRDLSNDGTWRGDISVQDSLNATLVNNIAWRGSANANNSAINVAGSTSTAGCVIRNCITYTGTPGQNSVVTNDQGSYTNGGGNQFGTNPLFVSAGTDFRLQSGSPGRNGGTSALGVASTDLLGNARVQGSAVDIGCYEFLESALSIAADAGSYALTGVAASLERGREILALAGSYGLTGTAATLLVDAPFVAYELDVDAGAYAITGVNVELLVEHPALAYELDVLSGSYAWTGTDALLLRSPQNVVRFWNGTDWIEAPVYMWNGADWVPSPLRTWDGINWV